MSEAFEPYAPPKANLARPGSPELMLLTPEGLPRLRSLLKAALRVWRTALAAIAVIVLAVHLPLNVFREVFFGELGDDWASWWRYASWSLALELSIGTLSSLALAWLVEGVRKGSTPSPHKCFAVAVSRWLPGIWTQILLYLLVLLGLVSLLVPGLFIAVATTFSLILVALRNLSGPAALHGSWDLIRERWWPSFRLLVLLFMCEVGLGLGLGGVYALLPEHRLILVAEGLTTDFITAYFFIATVILFLELEVQLKDASEAPDRLPVEGQQV